MKVDPSEFHSQWCKLGESEFTDPPNEKAVKLMKAGRQTVYNGPVNQSLACNVRGWGSDTHALVAVSTKYFPKDQSGWNEQKPPYCGQCLCIHVLGAELTGVVNKPKAEFAQQHDDIFKTSMEKVKPFRGATFMGKVADRCGECNDDSIDIFMDRPYAFSPVSTCQEYVNAPIANSKSGYRLFDSKADAYSVGSYGAIWNWVPCDWTHEMCAAFVEKEMGYKTFTPKPSQGNDKACHAANFDPSTCDIPSIRKEKNI
jgi:hypothetical protein